MLKIIIMEGKRQSLQKGRASRFSQKSCLSQWWPWERRPILVVMKIRQKDFWEAWIELISRLYCVQARPPDFLHKTSEIFLLSTKTKKLKNIHTFSAKTRSLENIFFLGDLYATHSTKKQNIPLFRSCPCLKPAAAERAHWLITQFILSPAAMNILHAHTTLLEPFPCVFKFGKFYMHISHLFNFLLFHLF